jgi:hypothetical protein
VVINVSENIFPPSSGRNTIWRRKPEDHNSILQRRKNFRLSIVSFFSILSAVSFLFYSSNGILVCCEIVPRLLHASPFRPLSANLLAFYFYSVYFHALFHPCWSVPIFSVIRSYSNHKISPTFGYVTVTGKEDDSKAGGGKTSYGLSLPLTPRSTGPQRVSNGQRSS